MSKELAIGEIGVIDGVKVECVKAPGGYCYNCALKEPCRQKYFECCCDTRSDHTDVYFKKIEE